MLKKLSHLVLGFTFLISSFLGPQPAHAYAPIIASCSNGLLTNGHVLFPSADENTLQTFKVNIDNYTLDAVSLRLQGSYDPKIVEVKILDFETTIAETTSTVSPGTSWVYFDLNNVALQKDKNYSIDLLLTDPHFPIGWKYTTGDCYSDGVAIVGGYTDSSKDFGFAVYASPTADATNQPTSSTNSPSEPQATVSPTSTVTAASSNQDLPGSTSQGANTQPSTQPTWTPPSKDDILKATFSDKEKTNPWQALFTNLLFSSSFMGSYILSFIFLVLLVFIMFYLIRRRKRLNQKETDKNKDKSETKKE
jgi:hypothetical protein